MPQPSANPAPVLISVGTRPEIIKMAPVHAALRQRGLPVAWVHTGQHREMADALYQFFDIVPEHEITLERRNGSLAHLNGLLLEGLSALYEQLRPRAVLVHGDTTSTLASAQAAFYNDVPIGHVEAGLRTFNAREPFPEEKNRELTARLARWHFAPTPGAAANLAREGIADSSVHMVGNTAVDAALAACSRLDALQAAGQAVLPPAIDALRRHGGTWRLITVTAHRRENWGDGIAQAARAVAQLLAAHDDLAVVWPVHGNPAVSEVVHRELGALARDLGGRLTLCPPLDYPALLWCLRRSVLALTDSGGIQEEGAALSTPVLVLRNTTERPELIAAGAGQLVGTDTAHIVHAVNHLLADAPALLRMRQAVNPFGDGQTAVRVARTLQHDLDL
jgi:UDP-N-acetylglucosamine 2-epimerase